MWTPPHPGDIVWCLFPQRARDVPGPRPRPALVVSIAEYEDGLVVGVAYGTSRKTDRLVAGEFAIRRAMHAAAYALAGLSYDTKFDLGNIVELPWGDSFFGVPPAPRHGRNPKLGSLHIDLGKALKAAANAVKSQTPR